MGVEAQIPTLITVVLTAAIDSVNPCAIGVLILMLSSVLAGTKKTGRILALGLTYIFAIMLVYILAGLGLVYFFAETPLVITAFLSILVAIILTVAGVIEIKDYFWYGKGYTLGIPPRISKYLPDLAKNTSFVGVFVLGAFVAAVELPCTGAPYLAIITILSQYFDFTAVLMLILYNFVFVLPLIIILFVVAFSHHKLTGIKDWKNSNRRYMRLAIGVTMVILSWLLMLISNGVINLG